MLDKLDMSHIACFILYPILLAIGSSFASTALYQVYPSEYAYPDDSVTRAESISANCRRYPPRDGDEGIVYTHCDGEQLKLSDSDRGSNTEYTATSYYVWTAGSNGPLLFIFPTRVSLTTITLHYYSDSDRGLPELIFYAVPDNFDVWDASSGTPIIIVGRLSASTQQGGEPVGMRSRNVTIVNANLNTKKVLMIKLRSKFQFAASEVEFFTNIEPITTTLAMTDHPSPNTQAEFENFATINSSSTSMSTITTSMTDSMTSVVQSNINTIAIGVSIAMLLILSIALIITAAVLIWSYKKRSSKQVNNCSPYSTLNRRAAGQPQPLQQDSAELYDQIHLGPSTGQTEYILTANMNNPSQTSQNSHPIYSIIDKDIAEHSSTSHLSSQKTRESTSEQHTYAAINENKKKEDLKHNMLMIDKGPPHTIEDLHTEMMINPSYGRVTLNDIESSPSISPYIVEELYTPVQMCSVTMDEEEAPPMPLYSVID